MRRSLIVMLALLAFSMLPHAQAQEKKDEEKQTETVIKPAGTSEEASAEASAEAGEETQESDDNFIPTEKINVDSSVSFPVDI